MTCPFCGSEDVEVVSPWGGQIITCQVRCRACNTYFEAIRDSGEFGSTAPPAADGPEPGEFGSTAPPAEDGPEPNSHTAIQPDAAGPR